MKIVIDTDEWYPVYYLAHYEQFEGIIVEVPFDQAKRYKQVFKDFQAVQEELKTLYSQGSKE